MLQTSPDQQPTAVSMPKAGRRMNNIERKNQKIMRDSKISRDIRHYGKDILQSEEFHQASLEPHHLHGTVSEHTLNVCIIATRICRILEKNGRSVNEKDVIQAALCHDLGMLGRDKQYKNRTDSWKQHPEISVDVARDLVPDLSQNAEEMISTHMWPVSGPPPHSREAAILNIADKCASAADWIYFITGKQIGTNVRENLKQFAQGENSPKAENRIQE